MIRDEICWWQDWVIGLVIRCGNHLVSGNINPWHQHKIYDTKILILLLVNSSLSHQHHCDIYCIDVGDARSKYVGDKVEMLMTNFFHWKSQQHNDVATIILKMSPSYRCHQYHCNRFSIKKLPSKFKIIFIHVGFNILCTEWNIISLVLGLLQISRSFSEKDFRKTGFSTSYRSSLSLLNPLSVQIHFHPQPFCL